MPDPNDVIRNADGDTPDGQDELPPGDHPLEVAARRGFGPLSPKHEQSWHGNAAPCVSCGLLAERTQIECDYCGQDLSDEMLAKMSAHAGPWFVFEHVRPFPGVSLNRLIRQIRRGTLTETSIVRGPPTHFQWRFAVETPGLCQLFGRCWRCHADVTPSDGTCPACRATLAYDEPKATSSPSSAAPQELRDLTTAVHSSGDTAHDNIWDEPPRIGGFSATWVAVVLVVLVILALMWITQLRTATDATQANNSATSPALVCSQVSDGPAAMRDHGCGDDCGIVVRYTDRTVTHPGTRVASSSSPFGRS